MYAVIKTGGKQYRVADGDIITVEKLAGDPGSIVALAPVLMLDDDKAKTVGTPVVEGASVSAEVLEQTRGDKIIVFKKKRRKGYRRTRGHRQDLTVLRITDVTGKSKAAPKRAAAKKAEPAEDKDNDAKKTAAKPAAKKPAAKKPAAKKSAARKPAGKAADKKPAAKRTTTKRKSGAADKSADKE